MAHVVKCRLCKQHFDTDKLNSNEWIMPNPKYYYHKHCYDNWIANKNNAKANIQDADFWYESLVDYLYRDVKMSIDFPKLKNQWNSFTKKKMTPKGIYFTVRYYYDAMHGNIEKSLGGIGIVPSIYSDATKYWTELETRKIGTIESIISQIKEREARPVKEIVRKEQPKKSKARWSLDEI